MKEAIAIINNSKMQYTDISAFGNPVLFVHAGDDTLLKVTYTEDCYSFYDYRTKYLYENQDINDLELHIKSIAVGIDNSMGINAYSPILEGTFFNEI